MMMMTICDTDDGDSGLEHERLANGEVFFPLYANFMAERITAVLIFYGTYVARK